ncbi:MAG: YqcC family protein [Luminiphilus sp.]|nr:YqcC family protein [Luminiphilus sp.]
MQFDDARSAIAEGLIDLEAALRQLDLWSADDPPPEALASDQPFAMDTLELEQWLQFIFLPTVYDLLRTGAALPERCAVAPMAEETIGKRALPTAELVSTLEQLDRLITDAN